MWKQELLCDTKLFVQTAGGYMSKRGLQFDNLTTLSSHHVVDGRTGFRRKNWSITGYVNNLMKNKEITAVGIASPNFNISLLPPAVLGFLNSYLTNMPDKRQFGLRLTYLN